jgi:hypothetical protein
VGKVERVRRLALLGAAVVLALALLEPATAHADPGWLDKVELSGYLQTDVRFDIDNSRGPTPGQGYTFSLNRNDFDLKLKFTPYPGVVAVVEPRVRYYGFVSSQTLAVADLWNASAVSPFTMYLDQAYVALKSVPAKWIDVKAGRMQVTWGSVDVFSPNDNINSKDLSDPLDYTRKVPNEMVEIDAYPSSRITLNLVWVPIFQPAWLPPSAPLAYAVQTNAQGCLTGFPPPPLTVAQNQQLEKLFTSVNPCSLNFQDPTVTTYLPSNQLTDMQVGFRARAKLGDLDVGLNYYYGRFGFPVAYDATIQITPGASKTTVNYSAEVVYPRMHVIGADFNYSSPELFDLGITGDVAVIVPEPINFGLGIYENGTTLFQQSNQNVTGQPFVKGAVGVERTFGSWLYLDALFVHGFFDEFADVYGLHNYVSLTPELSTLEGRLKLRVANFLDLTNLQTNPSYVLYPQLTWTVLPSVETMLGAFILGGDTEPKNPLDYASRSKFGQLAAGRDEAVWRVTVTW